MDAPDPVKPFTAALLAVTLICAVGVIVQSLDRHCLLPCQIPDVWTMVPRGSGGSPTLID